MTEQAVPRITQRAPVPSGEAPTEARSAEEVVNDGRVRRALIEMRMKKDQAKQLKQEIADLEVLLVALMSGHKVPVDVGDVSYVARVQDSPTTYIDIDKLHELDPTAYEKATTRKPVTNDEFVRLVQAGHIPAAVAAQVIRTRPTKPSVRFDKTKEQPHE